MKPTEAASPGWGYRYVAEILSIHDGDTMTVDVDLGFNVHHGPIPIRLAEYNAPEMPTGVATRNADDPGLRARTRLVELVGGVGSLVWIEVRPIVVMSFTRYIARGYYHGDGTPRPIADAMKESGFDVPLASGRPLPAFAPGVGLQYSVPDHVRYIENRLKLGLPATANPPESP